MLHFNIYNMATFKVLLHSSNTVSYTHLTAADEEDSVDLGGRRIIKKKKSKQKIIG